MTFLSSNWPRGISGRWRTTNFNIFRVSAWALRKAEAGRVLQNENRRSCVRQRTADPLQENPVSTWGFLVVQVPRRCALCVSCLPKSSAGGQWALPQQPVVMPISSRYVNIFSFHRFPGVLLPLVDFRAKTRCTPLLWRMPLSRRTLPRLGHMACFRAVRHSPCNPPELPCMGRDTLFYGIPRLLAEVAGAETKQGKLT